MCAQRQYQATAQAIIPAIAYSSHSATSCWHSVLYACLKVSASLPQA
jgi:hypothetical protein